MAQPLCFVSYGPSSTETAINRHIVSNHIGKYYRNRSRPSIPRPVLAKPTAIISKSSSKAGKSLSDKVTGSDKNEISNTVTGSQGLSMQLRLNTGIDQQKMDPFQSCALSMTPQMQPAFVYYFSTIMPVVEPTFREREEYQRWLMPLIMSETALHYALIACMTRDIEQASVTSFGMVTRKPLHIERQQYNLRALRALNECLSDPVRAAQPSVLMAVHFLLWQEIFNGEENVQLADVQRLLDLRGGFHGIQRKAMEAIIVGSIWKAIRTRTKPQLREIVDPAPYSLRKLSETVNQSVPMVSRLGEGFLKPSVAQHFDKDVCKIFEDARCIWTCYEMIGIHSFTTDQKRSISIQRMNLDHRSLCYSFSEGSSRFQEACLRSFIIYSNAHYNVIQPSSKIARRLVQDLKDTLLLTDLSSCWSALSTVLVWTLFLGAHMSFGQPERSWFVVLLSKATRHCGFRSWESARQSLLSYYYSDRIFEMSFMAVWQEMEMLLSVLG